MWKYISGVSKVVDEKKNEKAPKAARNTREYEGRVNFWASENWSGRVHFEGHSPEWRVLSKLSVQPCRSSVNVLPEKHENVIEKEDGTSRTVSKVFVQLNN